MLEVLGAAVLAACAAAWLGWRLGRGRGAAPGRGGGELAGLRDGVARLAEQARGQQAGVHALLAAVGEVRQAAEAQRAAQGEARLALGAQLAEARAALERLRAEAAERARRADEAHVRLARLEALLAGSARRGAAGENVLAAVLRQLPPELRAYGLRVNGRVVEFAIPLPDGRYLPVDSKWTSAAPLEALARCKPEERAALVAQVQREVAAKVDEVARYLDPERTCMLAVLAVPDAVYDLCAEAHVRAARQGVAIVAYSLAVPYVLSVVQLARRFGARVDEAQLAHALGAAGRAVEAMAEELDGRLARALATLENSRRDLRTQVGQARQALAQVRVEGVAGAEAAALPPSR